MTTIDYLPPEVISHILKHLHVGDLLAASRVSYLWREMSALILADKVSVMLTDDVFPALDIFTHSIVPYKTWVFKEVELNFKGNFSNLWHKVAPRVESLMLLSVDITEADFVKLLCHCTSLKQLGLNGLSHILMTGNLLNNPDDIELLKDSLRNVNSLHLACSRYLTDAIFSRITSTLGPLVRLSLAGCQISYQNAIYKRFYPPHLIDTPSEHVLTFKHILGYIESNSHTLKEISLGRTSIDSTSLHSLAVVPELNLTSVHLMSCDQLTKAGIERLCQSQKNIKDLDLSLCSRLTDYAILAICEHLPGIKVLRIRRCRGITEAGIRAIRKLKALETLDISHLDHVTAESVHEALCREERPTLEWLSVSSIPIEGTSVIVLSQIAVNIKYLDLSMCVVGATDKSIQEICKNLTRLETLNLNGCITLSDIGLAGCGLANESDVPTLDAVGNGLSLENLGLRAKDPYKIQLGSKEERKIREEAEVKKYLEDNVEQIIESTDHGISNLQKLQQLNLCGCARVTDITLIHALCLPGLKNLNLAHCQQVTQAGLVTMARNCPSLETLTLTECAHITDQTILAFAHHLKRIKTLDLQKCSKLTDDSLDSLSHCHSLMYLDVSGCIKMSLEEIEVLQSKRPRLQNLHHRGIKAKSEEGKVKEELWKSKQVLPTPPPLLSKLKKKISS